MITLRLDAKTTKTETWIVTTHTKIYRATVARVPGERAIDRQRKVLNMTVGEAEYRSLGNRRVGNCWVTEWTTA